MISSFFLATFFFFIPQQPQQQGVKGGGLHPLQQPQQQGVLNPKDLGCRQISDLPIKGGGAATKSQRCPPTSSQKLQPSSSS